MTKHWHSRKTQVYWTCKALIAGHTINHMDEIGETSGWRLGAIIDNLRSKYKWLIETGYVGPESIAHYSLRKGYNWRLLDFPGSARKLKGETGDA